ncbi:MAG: cytochrome d ubiquinol oxidase subunit II [Rhabdochlamydiaceae bacterium]|jgi:cytochrome d ubiquinol oxidase subunit II
MNLGDLWYIVVIACMVCYAMLDGFDLGVGSLHLFAKKDTDRRVFLNAIGPVWDGNEVWLVIVGGALFAGFPEAYATIFSAFYNLVMILLAALIFRAAGIEFRSKLESPRWRKLWDSVFFAGSVIIAFGVGLVVGNLIVGIPLDSHRDFVGSFSGFFNPYSILVGITTLALFMMHGAIYLVMKTEGALHHRLRRWVKKTIFVFIVCYVTTTLITQFYMPHMLAFLHESPWLVLIPLVAFGMIVNIPLQMYKGRDGWAFIYSCLSIAMLTVLFAIGTFPMLIRSSIDPEANSLIVANAVSSDLTLKVLLIIVAIGLPLVFAYGVYVYRLFRGKVKLDKSSY